MWRVVVVERAGSGGVRVVESQSFAAGEPTPVALVLERLKVERLVRVLPASSCVSKAIEVPESADADLASALSLLAEAHLPAGLPPHRRAWGVVPGPASDGNRAAFVIGWAGEPDTEIAPGIETCTSELVALAGLVEPRGSTIAVYADRGASSIALLAWNGTRSSVRAIRESAESDELWAGALTNLVSESAVRFGIAETPVPTGVPDSVTVPARSLWLDRATAARASRVLGGGPADSPRWLTDYGIAAGAASMCLMAGPASAPLFAITARAAVVQRTMIQKAVDWVTVPGRPVKLIAIGVALLLLVPFGTAYARRAIFQAKARAIEAARPHGGASADELDQQLAMYRELDKRRLPMAKLMADAAGAMPPGMTLDSLQISASNRSVTMRGKARERALITEFTSKLNATGVFADCDAGRADVKDDAVEFDVTGRVAGAFNEARGVENWAEVPLAVKLYGEEARKPRPAEEPVQAEKKPATQRGGTGTRRGGPVIDGVRDSKPVEAIPAALTDEQIKGFDRTKASAEMASRRKAGSRPDLEPAAKERLKAEVDKLRSRLRDLQSSSSSTPAAGGGS